MDELTELNARKEVFVRDLANSMKAVSESLTTITLNQQTALSVNTERNRTIGRRDLEVVQMVEQMGRYADERLLRYQYYMAKAYEYETLKPYTGSFQLAGLAKRIENVIGADNGAQWLNTPANVNELRQLYENGGTVGTIHYDGLRKIADDILRDKNTVANNRRFVAESEFRLSPEQLDELNATGSVTIDLPIAAELPMSRYEALKVKHMRARDLEATVTNPGAGGSANLELEFVHEGVSLLRDEGVTYQFRHHRGGSVATLVQEQPIRLGVSRQNVGLGGQLSHDEADLQQLALLSYLLDGAVQPNAEVLFAQPGAWAQVTIRKYVNTPGASITRADALFEVDYSYEVALPDRAVLNIREPEVDGTSPLAPAAATNALTTTATATAAGPQLKPLIVVAANGSDASGRGSGRGSFDRNYDKLTQVTLTAEPFYGGFEFDHWENDQNQTLGTSPTLTLTLSDNRSVQPVYRASDVTPPVAAIDAVTPNPRTQPVDAITIRFSEPVTGFDLADLSLLRETDPVGLGGAALSSDDGVTWTLSGLSTLTAGAGGYELTLNALGSGIVDEAGNELVDDASGDWVMSPVATVSGRYLFYNQSGYDGNDAALNAADDAAIATDKVALRPGQKATFVNLSS